MDRYLKPNIIADLEAKIVLLTGPRQCGKTTLAKSITSSYDYLNVDVSEDILLIKQKTWDRSKKLIIFDELHKLDHWKRLLKGVYDKEGVKPHLIVTGSAKLDAYSKVGDSLAGRYFQYRLYPFDLQELALYYDQSSIDTFTRLMTCGGFPEPFLNGTESYYKRWQKTHNDIILRQDLIDNESVRDIKSIELLVVLLKQRVASGVSYSNIARDLDRDPNTVKRWCLILENMYIIFRVLPYHDNVARSVLKEPKLYFYDIALVADEGARLENLVAVSLLKHLHWLSDTQGSAVQLNYCRTKDAKEIDFLCTIDERRYLIEVKTSDKKLSNSFAHFKKYFPQAQCIQLVLNLDREYSYPDGSKITGLVPWLSNLQENLI